MVQHVLECSSYKLLAFVYVCRDKYSNSGTIKESDEDEYSKISSRFIIIIKNNNNNNNNSSINSTTGAIIRVVVIAGVLVSYHEQCCHKLICKLYNRSSVCASNDMINYKVMISHVQQQQDNKDSV